MIIEAQWVNIIAASPILVVSGDDARSRGTASSLGNGLTEAVRTVPHGCIINVRVTVTWRYKPPWRERFAMQQSVVTVMSSAASLPRPNERGFSQHAAVDRQFLTQRAAGACRKSGLRL